MDGFWADTTPRGINKVPHAIDSSQIVLLPRTLLNNRLDSSLVCSSSVGLYGFDLYSLHKSMESVIEYLEKVDPDAAERTK